MLVLVCVSRVVGSAENTNEGKALEKEYAYEHGVVCVCGQKGIVREEQGERGRHRLAILSPGRPRPFSIAPGEYLQFEARLGAQ